MRKLASIRTIIAIEDIPNADAIVAVKVDGWTCVARKGLFQSGDKVIYFEIDSVLPESLLKASFLWNEAQNKGRLNGKMGDHLKSITIRGQLSQGLVLPLAGLVDPLLEVGSDVTEVLGVQKFEEEEKFVDGDILGDFPYFICKTDQERVQNLIEELAEMDPSLEFEVTEKLDGSSATFFYYNGHIGACSRNFEKKLSFDPDSKSAWDRVAVDLDLKSRFEDIKLNVALQGELIGPGIQSNKYYFSKVMWKIFDVFDIDQQRYLFPEERYELLTNVFGFCQKENHVPIISLRDSSIQKTIDELLNWADGSSAMCGKINRPHPLREGLVFKSHNFSDSLRNPKSFKVISNKWLVPHHR